MPRIKLDFPKLLTIVTLIYAIYCSVAKVENAIAYIGFLLSLVTLWAPTPNSDRRDRGRKNSDFEPPGL
jgi:hypothetical protein